MKHHLPALDSLKAFESAARHLSFSLAADELCITKGAISYQIRKLEEELQTILFRRSVRQVYLTDAGQALLQTTSRIFEEFLDTIDRLQSENQQVGVSIAVSTYVAARWLSSQVSQFNEYFPDVSVLFQHSVNSADFKLSEVDMAIKWGPCRGRHDPSRFGEIPMFLYPVISPKLLEKNGLDISKPLDISNFRQDKVKHIPLLCEDRKQDLWKEWFETSEHHCDIGLDNPRRIISDANVRVQAAIDGQGFILADDLMVNEINNGLLCAPFVEKLGGYGYAFMSSPTRIYSENARSLKKWLSVKLTKIK